MIESEQQQAWKRALDHARLVGLKPTWRVGDFYTVDSTRDPSKRYTIRRHTLGRHITYSCTCAAGMAGKVCQHAAVVAALPYECKLRRDHKQAYKPPTSDPLLEAVS